MDAKQRNAMYRKWVRWMDRIQRDVVHQFGDRMFWNGFLEAMKTNPSVQQSSHYPGWIAESHGLIAAVAIRRQTVVDRLQRDINLARVLCEIRDHPEVLSADRYAAGFPPVGRDLARETFAKYADPSGQHVSVPMIRSDLAQLRRDTHRVKRFVDTRVAHMGKWPQKKVPSFADVHRALMHVGDVFEKYDLLIRRKSWVNLEPVPQYELLSAFRQPWLP